MRMAFFAVLAAVGALGPAHADLIVDQSNLAFGPAPSIPTLAIGGSSRQQIAQTFTVGMTGDLGAIRMPIGCESGALDVELREAAPDGRPTGRLIRRFSLPAATYPREVPDAPPLLDILFSPTVVVRSGDRLSVTLANPTGSCAVRRAAPGETYPRGDAYFISLPETTGWITLDAGGAIPSEPRDLIFETVMATPDAASGGDCLIAGPVRIPSYAPVCRCLRDEGLREFRCALIDPDFFAIRRIPWPLPINGPYTETWEILPLTKLKGPIGLRLTGENIPNPVDFKFSGKSLRVLEMRKAVLAAPDAPAVLKGEATLFYGGEKFVIDRTISPDLFGPSADAFKKGAAPYQKP